MPTRLDERKRASVVQLLFRCARRVNAEAIARVRAATGAPIRPAHTLLFPHIDLAGTRATVIANRMGVSKQAVGQLVAELCAMGVLEQVPDPRDRRARLVRFVGGERGLVSGLDLLRGLEEELARSIGERRWRQLHAALLALDEVCEARAGREAP